MICTFDEVFLNINLDYKGLDIGTTVPGTRPKIYPYILISTDNEIPPCTDNEVNLYG